jgi:hypothetical protein
MICKANVSFQSSALFGNGQENPKDMEIQVLNQDDHSEFANADEWEILVVFHLAMP